MKSVNRNGVQTLAAGFEFILLYRVYTKSTHTIALKLWNVVNNVDYNWNRLTWKSCIFKPEGRFSVQVIDYWYLMEMKSRKSESQDLLWICLCRVFVWNSALVARMRCVRCDAIIRKSVHCHPVSDASLCRAEVRGQRCVIKQTRLLVETLLS